MRVIRRRTGAPEIGRRGMGAVVGRVRRIVLSVMAVLAVLSGLAASRARAQQPATLDVSADRTKVTVGDRIAVTLVLRTPAGSQPDFGPVEQQFGDGLDVLVVGLPEQQSLPDGRAEFRVRYEVAAFQPGATQIPPLSVAFDGPGGRATASASPLPIAVASVIPPDAAPTGVRDLKPQIDLTYRAGIPGRTIAIAVIAVLILLVAGALAARWLWRRLRTAPAAPVSAVAPSAAEATARAELDRIAALGLLDTGDVHQFHALLATCVRRYLSDHYGFPAFAMTTGELRTRMEAFGVDRWQARLAAGLLAECDAVAYAGYAPAATRAGANLAMAYEIVTVTPAPPEPAEMGAGP